MSIIFPLFGSNQQKDTDGYFLEGTDLKRIKSESFEIDTLFSNVNGFFVDTKENLYRSEGGNVKKYVKNFRTGNFNLAWQASGGFTGGNTLSTNQIDEANKLKEDAKNILIEHEKKISNSKTEVRSMISKAAEDAEKNMIKTNENFHNLMENRKRNAEERIKQLKNQALKDIKNTSVIIAIESVEKLLKNSLDKSKLDKIFSSSLEETKLALKKKSS